MPYELYRMPLYYDIAFSWDVAPEIELWSRLFRKHVSFPVETVLEAACGTGRFLTRFPEFNYRIVGFDISPVMAAYAMRRIRQAGVQERAAVLVGDMRTISFKRPFDAAFNSINSIGYLHTEADFIAHLRRMADSIKPGGIYLIHLNCGPEIIDETEPEPWTYERDGVRVTTTWGGEFEDVARRLSHQYCLMEIDDKGKTLRFRESHLVRLWLFDEWLDCIERSGRFTLEAVYTERGIMIPPGTAITGAHGNLYHLLRVKKTGV